jgi:hypothetical protein
MSLHVTGINDALRQLDMKAKKIKGATQTALLRVAFLIQRDAMDMTPVDTGALRASCFVIWPGQRFGGDPLPPSGKKLTTADLENIMASVAFLSNTSIEASISDHPVAFVGYAANYAVFVHENIKAQHETGQAFYLEEAILKHIKTLAVIIREEAHGNL